MIPPKFKEVYKVSTGRNKDYRFTTDSGVVYVIYSISGKQFIPDFSFSSDIVYVGFRPLNERKISHADRIKNTHDEKIMNTIFNFIFDILKDRDAIIAFNYSSENGKRIIRNRLFNIFYIRYNKNRFHKMDFELGGIGTVSIIFRKDNINFASICTITDEDIIRNIAKRRR